MKKLGEKPKKAPVSKRDQGLSLIQVRASDNYSGAMYLPKLKSRGGLLREQSNGTFFRSFKTEWMPKSGYLDFSSVVHSITEYIVGYYNRYRPHQFNAGLSPLVVEQEYQKTSKAVASFS